MMEAQNISPTDKDSEQASRPTKSPVSPPMPVARRRYFDGADEEPPIDARETGKRGSPKGFSRGSSNARASTRTSSFESPSRPTLDGRPSRKRSYRESSEESDGGAKRQIDDITPKFKRRQPQVASAYR